MILNEFLILVIGAGVGILLNMFMPDSRAKLVEYQRTVDDKMIHILKRMALYMERDNKSDYTGECFDELDKMLINLKKEALYYMNNHFLGENDYYYEYMQMRARQCGILKRVYSDIVRLTTTPQQVRALADFVERIAGEFAEENDVQGLLEELEALKESYTVSELPKSREEFENRAMLYHIMEDLKVFLQIKREFFNKF